MEEQVKNASPILGYPRDHGFQEQDIDRTALQLH